MPATDPAQYVVAGGSLGAFAFVVKMMVRYQNSVTSVAFDRIDRLEQDLADARRELGEERERCRRLETDHRKLQTQVWRLQTQIETFADLRAHGDAHWRTVDAETITAAIEGSDDDVA